MVNRKCTPLPASYNRYNNNSLFFAVSFDIFSAKTIADVIILRIFAAITEVKPNKALAKQWKNSSILLLVGEILTIPIKIPQSIWFSIRFI